MGDMPTCDHCGSTREVDVDANGAAICGVCRYTDAGLAHRYPKNHIGPDRILRAIAQCANLILEAIEDRHAR